MLSEANVGLAKCYKLALEAKYRREVKEFVVSQFHIVLQ